MKARLRGFLGLYGKRVLFDLLVVGLLVSYGFWVNPNDGAGGIPCLWKTCFGVECPGCGLSRAGAFLVRGELAAAIHRNWLIVPVIILLAVHFASFYTKAIHRIKTQ
jgi:hypothetical protein